MSEEHEDIEIPDFPPTDADQEEEGLTKPVALGLQPHPITGEMMLVLGIGEETTFLPFSAAKKLAGEIDITLTTGIALGTVMNLMSRSFGGDSGGNNGLIVPN